MTLSSANLNRRSFLVLSFGILVNFTFGKGLGKGKSRNLFVYYTRTLNTHILVSYIQRLVGGDLMRIQTTQSYPKDYQQTVALASKQRVEGFLPPLLPYSLDLSSYERVFIAAPLWDMDLCAPMKSFLSSANLEGKRVFFIITNAGYGLGLSIKSAKHYVKNISGVLDYKFKSYEKIVPNLRAINEKQILAKTAFNALDKDKIAKFLAKAQ